MGRFLPVATVSYGAWGGDQSIGGNCLRYRSFLLKCRYFPPRNSGTVILMAANPFAIQTVRARHPTEEILHSR
jgi:hypothetical protein